MRVNKAITTKIYYNMKFKLMKRNRDVKLFSGPEVYFINNNLVCSENKHDTQPLIIQRISKV